MAMAMIADIHHAPAEAQSRSSTSRSGSESVSAGQRWDIVSTSVSFQWVSMSYCVLGEIMQNNLARFYSPVFGRC